MKNTILFLILLFHSSAFCQEKYGHQWHFTNHNIIDFRANSAKIDIMFISGGCYVQNKRFGIMKNGDSINSKITYGSWCKVRSGDGNFPTRQNNVIIPVPNNLNKYFLYNLDFDTLTIGYIKLVEVDDTILLAETIVFPRNLYQNTIDMTGDNGLGEVIEKKKVVLTDTLCTGGYLTTTRHKNGKDWWLIVPEWRTNCYYVIPVNATGAGQPVKQCLSLRWRQEGDRGGQIDISPDGSKFARVNKRDTIVVFDFNNETGQFSNPIELYQPNKTDFMQGVCFSQNNRFLYVMHLQTVYQFDLKATDVQKSMKVIADIKPLNQDGRKGQFQFSRLAPDGKIYISSPFSHLYLSVINRPNCPGTLCDFRPYAIELKFYNWGALPNNPHFTMPSANYTCDSLNTQTAEIVESITLSPNPTTNQIIISSTYDFQNYTILNITGKTILKGALNSNNEIGVSALADGLYFLHLKNTNTQARAVGKFVVKH
jgi:hypothetical protein